MSFKIASWLLVRSKAHINETCGEHFVFCVTGTLLKISKNTGKFWLKTKNNRAHLAPAQFYLQMVFTSINAKANPLVFIAQFLIFILLSQGAARFFNFAKSIIATSIKQHLFSAS